MQTQGFEIPDRRLADGGATSCLLKAHQPSGDVFWKRSEKVQVLVTQSCLTLCDPMDHGARQAPLSMGFSGQEYWSGLPVPPAGDLPDPGIEPASPALAGKFFTTEPPGKPSLL